MTSTFTERPSDVRQPTYVYIAGRGHSGSTLLTLLLARHPKIAAVGEMSLLSLQIMRDEQTRWIGRCSCGERPLACVVWGQILREIELQEGVKFAADPFSWRISDVGIEEELRNSASFRVPVVWLRNRFWRLLRYVQYWSARGPGRLLAFYKPQVLWASRRSKLATLLASAHRVEAIVDASKDPLDMLDLYYYATLPVKVVFLTRDVRGNVWSVLKRLKQGQSRADAVIPAAKDWCNVNGRIWRLFQHIPVKDRLHLRYEDICSEPDAVMEGLFKFLGLDPVNVVSRVAGTSSGYLSDHTIGGNRIRFSGDELQIRPDTAWQRNLTVEEQSTIRRLTWALSRQLGYEQ